MLYNYIVLLFIIKNVRSAFIIKQYFLCCCGLIPIVGEFGTEIGVRKRHAG